MRDESEHPSRWLPELDEQLGNDEAEALRSTLRELATQARAALHSNLVGVYLKGSFALGHGDIWADVDFLVVTADVLTPQQEGRVRTVHRSLPQRPEHWAHHLEGSYASLGQLRPATVLDEVPPAAVRDEAATLAVSRAQDLAERTWRFVEHLTALTSQAARRPADLG